MEIIRWLFIVVVGILIVLELCVSINDIGVY